MIEAPRSVAGFSIAQMMLAEFDQELEVTRRFLQRLPNDKLTWKAHDKSMTAGQLALHIARVPGYIIQFALPDENTLSTDRSKAQPQPQSIQEILDTLDQSAAIVREKLPEIDDQRMRQTFHLTARGRSFPMPRHAFLRSIMLNHWYHHRGQFGVYLRLLAVSVPSSYGPSGDE